jgi:hypothetical protein
MNSKNKIYLLKNAHIFKDAIPCFKHMFGTPIYQKALQDTLALKWREELTYLSRKRLSEEYIK